MEQEKLESGVLTKALLDNDNEKSHLYNSVSDDCTTNTISNDSSIKASVVFSTFIAVCGCFCNGCAIAYSSPAESGIIKDLGLSVAQYSCFGSIMTIGGIITAFFSGKIVASIGQRHAMWISQLFCTIGWLAIALAKDALWLYAGRVSLGLGLGIITYVVPLYIAEIAPKNLRGAFSSANQLMVNCGTSLVYFIGNILPWRILALVGMIPFLVQFFGLFFIPESPRWLVQNGRRNESKGALQKLRGKNADVSQELADIQETMKTLKQQEEGISVLFKRNYLHPITVGVGLMMFQQFGGSNAVNYYASSIFENFGFSSRLGSTSLASIQIPIAIVGLYLMDISGRRLLLLVSASGMCLCTFLVGLSFCLQALHISEGITPIVAFIGIIGFSIAYSTGMAGIPWIMMSEIFPVNVKASAGSLVALSQWSATWITTYTFNFMMNWSFAGTFFIFSVVCALAVVFIWKLVPETKGRKLEEIQASFNQSVEQVF